MNKLRDLLRKLFGGAATYPVAAAVCFLIGVIAVYWLAGVFAERAAYSKAKKEYEAKTAEIQKTIQAALLEAEKAGARSKVAEDKANKIIQANTEKAAAQTKKDSALDSRIIQTQTEGKQKENEIENNFNNDLRRASSMSDDERAADICTRIERLAATNPAFAGYRCAYNDENANAPNDQ